MSSSGSSAPTSTTSTSLLPSWFTNSAAGNQWNALTTSMNSSQNTKYLVIFLVLILCVIIGVVYQTRKNKYSNTFLTSRLHRM